MKTSASDELEVEVDVELRPGAQHGYLISEEQAPKATLLTIYLFTL